MHSDYCTHSAFSLSSWRLEQGPAEERLESRLSVRAHSLTYISSGVSEQVTRTEATQVELAYITVSESKWLHVISRNCIAMSPHQLV